MDKPAPVPKVEAAAYTRSFQPMRLFDGGFVLVAIEACRAVNVTALIDEMDSIPGHDPSARCRMPRVISMYGYVSFVVFGCVTFPIGAGLGHGHRGLEADTLPFGGINPCEGGRV